MTDFAVNRRQLLLGGAALGAAASLGLPVAPAFAQNGPIRIGVGSDPVFAAYFVAAHEKLFAAEGVDAVVQTFTDGGEAMNTLVAGQVDIGCAAEPTQIIRMGRAPLRPLCVVYESGRYSKLCVRGDINDAKEIKKFGVVIGSVSEYMTRLAIPHYGMDANVELVPSGPPELPALLARGDIDAYFVWEPWPSMGVQNGGKILATSADVGYVDTQWATASQAIFDARPDDLHKVLQALAKGATIVRDDPKRAAAAIKAITSIPEDISLKALADYTAIVRDFTQDDLKSYDKIAQFLAQAKITPSLIDYRADMQVGFYKG